MFLCKGSACSDVKCNTINILSYDSFVEARSILYITMGKEYSIGKYYFSNVDEFILYMKNINLDVENIKGEDLKYVGGVINYTKRRFEDICLNIEGPFTILCTLINPIAVFKDCRKSKDKVHIALKFIVKFQKEYLDKIGNVKIISYADPSGDLNVLGPKTFKEFVAPYNINLIEYMINSENKIIHLCGRLSTSLEKIGAIDIKKVNVNSLDTYENHILSLKEPTLLCNSCIKMLNLNRKILYIGKIK